MDINGMESLCAWGGHQGADACDAVGIQADEITWNQTSVQQ